MKSSRIFRLDWHSAALLIAVVFTVAVRLETTGWTPDLGYVESAAVLGTLLGLAVGLSNFNKSIWGLLLGLYTVFVVPFQVTRIITGEETELGRLASLFGRLLSSMDLLITGKRIEDYIFFVTLMSILFWFVGF